jgi:hypothetical protein
MTRCRDHTHDLVIYKEQPAVTLDEALRSACEGVAGITRPMMTLTCARTDCRFGAALKALALCFTGACCRASAALGFNYWDPNVVQVDRDA